MYKILIKMKYLEVNRFCNYYLNLNILVYYTINIRIAFNHNINEKSL